MQRILALEGSEVIFYNDAPLLNSLSFHYPFYLDRIVRLHGVIEICTEDNIDLDLELKGNCNV